MREKADLRAKEAKPENRGRSFFETAPLPARRLLGRAEVHGPEAALVGLNVKRDLLALV